MISNVLAQALADDATLGLTKGVDLFAENGVGDVNVVVKSSDILPANQDVTELRIAYWQCLLKGYPMCAGYTLAEGIVDALKALHGSKTQNGKTYFIKWLELLHLPYPYRAEDIQYFTINGRVGYRATP